MSVQQASVTGASARGRRCSGILGTMVIAFGAVLALARTAEASSCIGHCGPAPDTDTGQVAQSSNGSVLDMGTHFLDRIGTWTNYGGATGPANFNPEGGGGPTPPAQRYRAWLEGYGVWSRSSARDSFVGDQRRIYGGVAGIGATLAPGFNVGASVDQGRTKVDVSTLPQSATIDLTQFGLTASYELGAWTAAAGIIRGLGTIDSTRVGTTGTAGASYDATLWGAVGEVSYTYTFGNSRIVPKAGFDWVSVSVDPFTESGSADAVSALGQSSRRLRLLAGAEAGHSWIVGTTIYDLGVYGKFVDVVSQHIDTLEVTSATTTTPSTFIQGVNDARFGFETGAALSVFLTDAVRAYAYYDGKFRDGFQSQGGTLGLEVKW